jgi:uncharacterized surface protein with fasciclin (FAS1) repeats
MLRQNFKSQTFALILCGLVLACNPSGEHTDAPSGTDSTSTPASGNASNSSADLDYHRGSEESEALRKELTAEVNNTTSPYRYIITAEDYSIFASLVKASTLSKHIHGAGMTLLAPKNRAFEGTYEYKTWLQNGDVAKIDAFVAPYILKGRVSYKELKEEANLTNYLGNTLSIDVQGGVTVGGASVSTEEVFTKNGIVIGMNELMSKF